MARVQNVIILMALIVIASSNAVPITSTEGKCKKDMLIIVDASASVGQNNFDKVKKFLKELVNNPDLNVSPKGSHVAFIVFSSLEATKILQDFNHENQDTSSLNSTIHRLEWNEKGYTRTDKALEIANQIFKYHSPSNHRDLYDDVILLLTDGKPHNKQLSGKNVIEATKDEARLLRDKEVTIIGVGIGNLTIDILRNISSPGLAINAESFDALQMIKNKLVEGSCIKAAETCTCSAVDLGDWIIETDSPYRQVTWDIPKPECTDESMNVTLQTTKPDDKPGEMFSIGRQNIEYIYAVGEKDSTTVTCEVSFQVTGPKLCRGKVYPTDSHICCCGVIHEKQGYHQCCGTEYIQKTVQRCCPGSTIRNRDQDCSGAPCRCAEINLPTKYIKEADETVNVTWAVPRPTCGGRLRSIPKIEPGQKFAAGVHVVEYLYRTPNKLDVTCRVRFEIKACSCAFPGLKEFRVTPGDTTMAVNWTVPLSACPEAITNTELPAEKPGDLFSIGVHTISYTYTINNQFDVICKVAFEVRGALCRDKGYISSKQICCCGTLHDIIPDQNYQCCGQDYYLETTHHCCRNSVVRPAGVSCPRE